MSNLSQRLLLFFVVLPAALALIVLLPFARHAVVVLMILAFALGAALELRAILLGRGFAVSVPAAVAAALGPPLLLWLGLLLGWPAGLAFLAYPLLGLLLFSPLALARGEAIAAALPTAAGTGLLLAYPGLLSLPLVLLVSEPARGTESILAFILVTFSNDSLAWLAGTTIGRRRGLLPVSPNKSLEGFLGGMAGSIGGALLLPSLFEGARGAPWWALAAFGLATGSAVILGDLFESALKRSAGVKDSGTLMPGRGGVLDSVDSLLFAAPVFYAGCLLLGLFRG